MVQITNTTEYINGRRTVARLDVRGQSGRIDFLRRDVDARRGQVRVMVKLHGEKEFVLMPLRDNMAPDDMKAAITARVCGEYVAEWYSLAPE